MASSLKLEYGKFYRRRNGEVVGPIIENRAGTVFRHRIEGPHLDINSWTSNGRVWSSSECEHDLVAEVDPSASLDPVNHPDHYTAGAVECIDAIKASMSAEEFQGYLKGNAQKYLWRYRHKGGVESLQKARWYTDRLIAELT